MFLKTAFINVLERLQTKSDYNLIIILKYKRFREESIFFPKPLIFR